MTAASINQQQKRLIPGLRNSRLKLVHCSNGFMIDLLDDIAAL
jgi:hypothetical protein